MIVQQDCHANSPHCRESSHPSQQTIPNNKHCLRASSLLYLFNSCPCFTGAPHLTTSHAPTQQHMTSGAMTSRNKIRSRLLPLLGDPLMHLARARERPAFIIPTLALHCSRLTGIVWLMARPLILLWRRPFTKRPHQNKNCYLGVNGEMTIMKWGNDMVDQGYHVNWGRVHYVAMPMRIGYVAYS